MKGGRGGRGGKMVGVAAAVGWILSVGLTSAAEAGAYVSASSTSPDRITHSAGYIGIGGELEVTVCIDPTDPNRFAIETPVKNIVAAVNAFAPATPNLIFGANNDIPSGDLDFESLTLHEFGHCLGLAHPNLASESDLCSGMMPHTACSAVLNGTKAEKGGNGVFDVDAGTDTEFGSSDDLRSDDVNRHWFEPGVNNPFLLPAKVDGTTYDRTGVLPAGHLFAANAGRDVGPLLGFPDTEAVMQQGQFSDEDQRQLQNDDAATFMLAMTGFDETVGTADDYTIKLVYAGFTTACDISIETKTSGLGSCSYSWSTPNGLFPNHQSIVSGSGTFRYNKNRTNWYFNPILACLDATLDWPHNQLLKHSVCGDITLEDGFLVGATGDVTLEAANVIFENDTSVEGDLTVVNN